MTEETIKTIERINQMKGGEMAYLVYQSPLHELEGGIGVDDLKALANAHTEPVDEVKRLREILEVAPCIDFGGCLIEQSERGIWIAKNQFKWHWDDKKGRCLEYPTAFEAFAALKTDPDAWFEIEAGLEGDMK